MVPATAPQQFAFDVSREELATGAFARTVQIADSSGLFGPGTYWMSTIAMANWIATARLLRMTTDAATASSLAATP